MSKITLWQGDCLEEMKKIPDDSVDMVLCDLPYGTTNCAWDKVIPFEPLWEQYKRVCKKNAAIILFSQQPFATDLINSNRKMFRYEWIWDKVSSVGFLNAHKMPLRRHENILVFYQKLPTYNPQTKKGVTRNTGGYGGSLCYGKYDCFVKKEKTDIRFPVDVIKISNAIQIGKNHPTQKPVPLLKYLIRTYTNEGETVLDNTMGSGSTGVACVNTNRNFIGIELDEHYFNVARQRINDALDERKEE